MLTEYSLITADAGYHSKANLKALEQLKVDALIADGEDAPPRRPLDDPGSAS